MPDLAGAVCLDDRTLIGPLSLIVGPPLLIGLVAMLALARRGRVLPPAALNLASLLAAACSLAGSLALAADPQYFQTARCLAVPLVPLRVDALSVYFILMINIVAFVAAWSSWGFLSTAQDQADPAPGPATRLYRNPLLFHMLVNWFHVTMLVVTIADNLIMLWTAVEATTLASTLLISYQNRPSSWEAAWKYLILTSTGIIFALLGTMFLAHASGDIPLNYSDLLANITTLQAQAHRPFVLLSFLFILVGYGTKAGLIPTQTWLPDGHGEAPAPISALLSGVLLKCALLGILRFYVITVTALPELGLFTAWVLAGVGLGSLLLATPFILKENRFKRVLAYHSLEHMGIIVFGLGVGSPIAVFGALLHMLNHAITKSLMFLAFGHAQAQYDRHAPPAAPGGVTGVLQSMPLTGVLLGLGGLALVGMPPFNIFLSEVLILWGAIEQAGNLFAEGKQGAGVAAVAGIALFLLATVLIFYGMVRHLARIVLNDTPLRHIQGGFWRDQLPLAMLGGLVLVFGLTVLPPLAALLRLCIAVLGPTIR